MMKVYLFLVVLFAFASAEVVVLDDSNFDEVVFGSDAVLVKFFAPWCGHCKKLAEPYKSASSALAGKAVLAEVDCDEHKTLCSKFSVSGYPTLKWFPRNSQNAEAYNGGRDVDGIVSWVNENIGPIGDIYPLPSFDQKKFDDTLEANKKMFIKFFAPWCGHCKALAPKFKELSDIFYMDDVVIAEVDCDIHKKLCAKYKVTGYPTLMFFDGENSEGERYNDEREVENLLKFVNGKTEIGRKGDGMFEDHIGRIPELDEVVEAFAKKDEDYMKGALQKVDELVPEAGNKYSKLVYRKVIERMIKDNTFVTKEKARISSLLDKPMKREVLDRILLRANILRAFE